jgi:xanthine/uracil permease
VFLSSFAGAVSVASVVGVPPGRTHDELSYLLAADTYARGRLTNPQHPMWQYFETPHVLQQPTYMSKYQPAQGMALAFGSRLGGRPILGVWISAAFMCATVLWMLLAWLPQRWAIFGAVLTSLQFGIVGYWAQSYWGAGQ